MFQPDSVPSRFALVPQNVVAWCTYIALILSILYTIVGLGTQVIGIMDSYGALALMQPICILLFNAFHSTYVFGPRASAAFLLTVLLLSYAFESINVASGIFFGDLEYNKDTNSGFMGGVPVDVPFSYYMLLYPCFSIASFITYAHDLQLLTPEHVVLPPSDYAKRNQKSHTQIFLLSLTVGFIYGSLGAVIEPTASDYARIWIHESSGFYFELPYLALFGWAFTAFVITLSYLYLERLIQPLPIGPVRLRFAMLPLLAFLCISLVFVINAQPPTVRGIAFFALIPPIFLALARICLLSQRLQIHPNADVMDDYQSIEGF